MSRLYGYAIKISAFRAVDPSEDEDAQEAMKLRKDAVTLLEAAGFAVESTGKFQTVTSKEPPAPAGS